MISNPKTMLRRSQIITLDIVLHVNYHFEEGFCTTLQMVFFYEHIQNNDCDSCIIMLWYQVHGINKILNDVFQCYMI